MLHLIFSSHNPDKQLGPDGKWISLKSERLIDLHGRKKPQVIFDESAWRKAVRDDGDPLAMRRLYELGKPIWYIADDTHPEMDDFDKLDMWLEYARDGYRNALTRLSVIKIIGNIGLEMLADEGNPNAKHLLDERVLNQAVCKNGLWLEDAYDDYLHDYVNRTKKKLPDCMVFLYLLPLDFRLKLHDSFNANEELRLDLQPHFVRHFFIEPEYSSGRLSEARKDQNAIEEGFKYTIPDLPFILRPFANDVYNEIRNSVELFLQYPEPYYMREIITQFFIKHKNIFTSNDKDPLLIRTQKLLDNHRLTSSDSRNSFASD